MFYLKNIGLLFMDNVFYRFVILENNISIMATTIAKIIAVQKLDTLNLSPIMLLASITIKTVMIKETKPSVNILRGKVKNLKIPPTIELTAPITKPVIIAQKKLATSTPGITHAEIVTTSPVIMRLIMKFNI